MTQASEQEQVEIGHSAESAGFNFEADGDGIELVFGLIGPTGVDLGKVFESLKNQLKAVDYEAEVIRLSKFITPYLTGKDEQFENEFERISHLMENGTKLRELTTQKDIVGRLGIASIRTHRKQVTGNELKPRKRVAYIVSSFKRPEEVELFRQVYGKAFTLISVYSPRQVRIQELTKKLRSSTSNPEELAVKLVRRDAEEEDRKLGQRVGKTFPLADYFVTADSKSELDKHLQRLIRLTFGDPYIAPSRDEQGMFFAQAAALRSLDLSRQVGAAIVDAEGSVLTTGCNEVPKFGGGQYWSEDHSPARDFELGHDSNVGIKAEIIEDVFDRLREKKWLSEDVLASSNQKLASDSLFGKDAFFKNSLLFDVIEYGRAVHAEAAAISDAARRGVPLQSSRLFCTTFPCHICARHIVASGIKEVVFVEPYEKSRTGELYSDSVSVEPQELSTGRANFRSFVGVAPRRYMDFFQMTHARKTQEGKILEMDEIAKSPKIKRVVLTYLAIEELVIRDTIQVPTVKGDANE